LILKPVQKKKEKQDIDNYFAQATAYALMFQERTGIIVDNFAILIACEDGLRQVFQGKSNTLCKTFEIKP
jgi:genome maintenance exonuclease 1